MRGGRGASRKAGGPVVWWRHDKRHARGCGPTQGLGAKGTRGAHLEHAVHARDAGGIKAQRLVEGRRGLPTRREGMRCGGGEVRAGRREGLWCGGGTTRGMHVDVARLKAWGPRVRAERTENMPCMFVTLEVSKLSGWLKAGARCRVEGRACDAGGRGASRKAGGPVVCGGGTQEACTGKRPDSRLGGQGHARSAPRTCSSCQ